jgi:sugar fermentation stimulation protein A
MLGRNPRVIIELVAKLDKAGETFPIPSNAPSNKQERKPAMMLPELIPARFLRRDNRFRVTVQVQGKEYAAHLPNSGRLRELLTSGRQVWLTPANKLGRRTAFDLQLVEMESGLVSVDARLPNHLFAEAIQTGSIPGFRFPEVEAEVRYGSSRLDFRLSGPDAVCWVEVKSVTLVEDGTAMFPDAPTERGSRHLGALVELRRQGNLAAAVFVIQRNDAFSFSPNKEADPDFSEALRAAASAGVQVRAFICRVSLRELVITEEIPTVLSPPSKLP